MSRQGVGSLTTDNEQRTTEMHQTRFIHEPEELQRRAKNIRAVLFDWDGVFNDGWKDLDGGSPFSEVGSMGVNMLRFALWLRNGVNPPSAVVTGQINPLAEKFVQREKFHGIYMGFINKPDAFDVFLGKHALKPEEVAFFFDDAIDLALTRQCGLRVMIGRKGGERFTEHVVARGDADIVTANSGGENGLREATEAVIELLGNFAEVFDQRAAYTEEYQRYLKERNATAPQVERGKRGVE
jgi:3-deoxy-D-manno-octulosonate 8-phosphate phosphatase (KDO 8-P phosphatase)